MDMEDGDMLAADCIVICCCCQCMILQILVFVSLKLPHKLLRKTKQYAKKFRARKKGTEILQLQMTRYDEDSFTSLDNSFRVDIKDLCLLESLQFGCGMNEIETVMEELSRQGQFAFGSFWGGEISSATRSLHSCLEEAEIDYGDIRYSLVELFGHPTSLYH